jgi:signal transduction histidine kinase
MGNGRMTDGLSGDARALLDAVAALSSDLELSNVLRRIVVAACKLTGARYGALGVIGADQELSEFITHGLSDAEQAHIGAPPRGHGILGLLIRHPAPLRLDHLHEHAASYGFPANHPPMASFLGVPVLTRGTVFGNLYLTEKEGGGAFTAQDQQLVEALANAAGLAIQNARAYALSERQRAWLEASARLSDALQPGTTTAEALALVTIAARLVSGARAVGIVDTGASPPAIVAVDGRDAAQLSDLVALHCEEIGKADDEDHQPLIPLADGRVLAVAPLRARLFGSFALVALSDAPRELLGGEFDLVLSFAEQAALALDRMQALSEREQLALVTERDRIARDLHDLVIQRLFATGLQLQGVRSQVMSPAVADRLDAAVSELDDTIREIRGTIFALQHRRGSSVKERLGRLIEEYTAVLGFRPQIRIDGPIDTVVPDDVAEDVLAVLREGLSNTARHGKPTRVEVHLIASVADVSMRLTDNGVGIADDRAESGLVNVRRRASDREGVADVTRLPGGGTLLLWQVPLS